MQKEASCAENGALLLAISVGNAEILLGCVENGNVLCRVALKADKDRTANEYALLFRDLLAFHGFSPDAFSHAMLASVCPALTPTVRQAAELFLRARVFLLASGSKTGLCILTDHPAELGADLVASAVGALARYAPPLLLVDLGTASTISAIDKNGAFVGCAIAPGIAPASKALSDAAALLPNVDARAPFRAIGKNTEESMQSGAVFGAAAMIDGMIDRMKQELGEENVTVLLSGGGADTVLKHLKHAVIKDEDLLLRGLYEIDRRSKKR